MLKDSEKKLCNGIIVYQLDRFARNRYDSATYKSKLKKNGVRVFSARENISDDASGGLMESVLEGMAEYFSLELGQKVIRGRKINAEKCYYNGGTVPLGYKIIEVDSDTKNASGKTIKKKKFAINEETSPIIKDDITMIFNTQDKQYEGKMPSISELECPFMGSDALPNKITIFHLICKERIDFLYIIAIFTNTYF